MFLAGRTVGKFHSAREIHLELAQFGPYLQHPLVLVGFTLMLMFGVHRQLIKSGILPKLTRKEGSGIVRLLIQYGFWIGLAVLISGILLQLLKP